MKKITKRDLEHRILMLELTLTTLQKRLEKVERQPIPLIGDPLPAGLPYPRWNEVTCKGGYPAGKKPGRIPPVPAALRAPRG